MKKLLSLGLLLVLPVSVASADVKMATVDLGKAFDAYYKTKEDQVILKQKTEEAQKEIQDKITDEQHIGDDVQKLDQESKDQTLSAEARADKAKARDQRGADLQAADRQLQEFKTERGKELQDEFIRRRKEVVDDITKVVSDYSAPQGYDLVLDKTSASASGVPIVLFTSDKLPDITQAIITKENANAPSAASGGAPTTSIPGSTH